MNYEQARQIGPDGPAPGKWNWSNFNDSIAPSAYTAAPCRNPSPERERCDHDTAEEAERHHYEYEIASIRWRPIDTATAHQLQRCDYPGCTAWADGASASIAGWSRGDFCKEHATVDGYRQTHPFTPGLSSVHS